LTVYGEGTFKGNTREVEKVSKVATSGQGGQKGHYPKSQSTTLHALRSRTEMSLNQIQKHASTVEGGSWGRQSASTDFYEEHTSTVEK
jgi:hypothetical protein